MENFTIFLPFTSQSLFQIPGTIVSGIKVILITIFPASVLPGSGITHYALSLRLTQRQLELSVP